VPPENPSKLEPSSLSAGVWRFCIRPPLHRPMPLYTVSVCPALTTLRVACAIVVYQTSSSVWPMGPAAKLYTPCAVACPARSPVKTLVEGLRAMKSNERTFRSDLLDAKQGQTSLVCICHLVGQDATPPEHPTTERSLAGRSPSHGRCAPRPRSSCRRLVAPSCSGTAPSHYPPRARGRPRVQPAAEDEQMGGQDGRAGAHDRDLPPAAGRRAPAEPQAWFRGSDRV
jgi:hypothetical protein